MKKLIPVVLLAVIYMNTQAQSFLPTIKPFKNWEIDQIGKTKDQFIKKIKGKFLTDEMKYKEIKSNIEVYHYIKNGTSRGFRFEDGVCVMFSSGEYDARYLRRVFGNGNYKLISESEDDEIDKNSNQVFTIKEYLGNGFKFIVYIESKTLSGLDDNQKGFVEVILSSGS